jgi:hypothetical protein
MSKGNDGYKGHIPEIRITDPNGRSRRQSASTVSVDNPITDSIKPEEEKVILSNSDIITKAINTMSDSYQVGSAEYKKASKTVFSAVSMALGIDVANISRITFYKENSENKFYTQIDTNLPNAKIHNDSGNRTKTFEAIAQNAFALGGESATINTSPKNHQEFHLEKSSFNKNLPEMIEELAKSKQQEQTAEQPKGKTPVASPRPRRVSFSEEVKERNLNKDNPKTIG